MKTLKAHSNVITLIGCYTLTGNVIMLTGQHPLCNFFYRDLLFLNLFTCKLVFTTIHESAYRAVDADVGIRPRGDLTAVPPETQSRGSACGDTVPRVSATQEQQNRCQETAVPGHPGHQWPATPHKVQGGIRNNTAVFVSICYSEVDIIGLKSMIFSIKKNH